MATWCKLPQKHCSQGIEGHCASSTSDAMYFFGGVTNTKNGEHHENLKLWQLSAGEFKNIAKLNCQSQG